MCYSFFLQHSHVTPAHAHGSRHKQPGALCSRLAGSGDKAAPAAGGGAGEAALRKEVAALRKHEAELAARVAALEAEAGAGTSARSELEAAKAGLEAQLKARAAAPSARRSGAEGFARSRDFYRRRAGRKRLQLRTRGACPFSLFSSESMALLL